MTQVFTAEGVKIPVTVVQAGPCKIIQVKNPPKDRVAAVQIGFGSKKRLNRAQAGHQKAEKFQYLRDFRVQSAGDYKVGQDILASDFQNGEYVDVIGIMKGRGYAGAMKRHGFHGFPASHGHNKPRSVGSIGHRFPQHTMKGTRMAGRMGGHNVTVKNLLIVDIDPEKNLLWISGAVPGTRGGLLKITTTGKKAEAAKLYSSAVVPKVDGEKKADEAQDKPE